MVYYKKCAACGHANELKSEFLIFCDSCGAKLEPNYTAWKKQNFGKTFEDFQKQYGIPHEQLIREQAEPQVKRRKVPGGLIILSIILLVFIGVGTIGYLTYPYVKGHVMQFIAGNQDKIIGSLGDKNFKEYSCGTSGLKVSSPLPLISAGDVTKQLPAEVQKVVQKMEVNTSGPNPVVALMVSTTSIQFVDGMNPGVEGAKQMALLQLQQMIGNMPATSDAEYSLNGIPGLLTKGTYAYNGKQMGINLLTLQNGNHVYAIMVNYDKSGDSGEQVAQKVINSVKIEM